MNRFRLFAFCVCTCVASGAVVAQDPLDEIYGQGVHAYFSGNLQQAEELFTQAIDAGSVDPRVFYFRGLTQSKMGGTGAGANDFQQGAEYEISGRKVVNVGKSLERVQGALRAEVEKARQAARLQARAQQAILQKARMEQLQQSGAAPVPSAGPDPFAGGAMEGQPKEQPKASTPTENPTVDPVPADDADAPADPFGDSKKDPFGDDPAADEPKEDAPAGDAGEDPFK